MLVISRKAGESFIIGDNIEVTVFETSGDKVKLGISAPRDIKVIRSELRETETINREAACSNVDTGALRRAIFEKKP
ncbi:Translational regulator CsrA [bioreactor metagenome]|uniref:Translational regulator CsrA n=1 Tax=bioreactor metagenome TaxID=1076179 RepID=A0A644YHW3_9ZZZZ